jgi:cobalamin biosynthesis protein CobT
VHIIYNAAGASWRRIRKNLGLMLSEWLLKENNDRGALLWAYRHLFARRGSPHFDGGQRRRAGR